MHPGLRLAGVYGMKRARIVRRSLLLSVASLLLAGCETLNHMTDRARNAFAPIAPTHPTSAAAPPVAATVPGTPKVADVSAGSRSSSPGGPPADDPPTPGVLHFPLPDGRIWMGRVANGEPVGAGDLRLADGTVVRDVLGIDDTALDGEYECTLPSGKTIVCVYFEGERLASLAEYLRRDEARRAALERDIAQARELAEAARGTNAPADPMSRGGLAAAVAAAQKTQARYASTQPADSVLDRPQLASAGPAASGCAQVEGAFSTTTGLSKVSFTAKGQGHFWQKTYGGARSYTFEVDFRWQGEASKMTFDYDEATYYDAAGQVTQRTRMPGGTVECRYDGREISIGGVSYFRQ